MLITDGDERAASHGMMHSPRVVNERDYVKTADTNILNFAGNKTATQTSYLSSKMHQTHTGTMLS